MEPSARRAKPIEDLVANIRRARTTDEALAALAEGLNELLEPSGGTAVMWADESTGHIKGRAAEPDGAWPNITKISIALDDPTSWAARCINTRLPVVVNDAQSSEEGKRWLVHLYSTKSLLFVPIATGDRVFGCAVVSERDRFRRFSEGDVDNAVSLASAAGRAAEHLGGQ